MQGRRHETEEEQGRQWTRFFVAKSAPDGKLDMREIDPKDPALADDPELQGDGAGTVRVENDDQVVVIVCTDEAAHELAERTFRDVASLAQEHIIPHKPYKPDAE